MSDLKKISAFISYSNEDANNVERVAQYLSESSFDVWFDKWSVTPGEEWRKQLDGALTKSNVVLFFIGAKKESKMQKYELELIFKDKIGNTKTIIPILLPGSVMENTPPFLIDKQFVDLRNGIDDVKQLNILISTLEKANIQNDVLREIEIGDELFRSGDFNAALFNYKSAIRIATAAYGDNHPILIQLLNKIGTCSLTIGNTQEANDNFQKALHIAEACGDKKSESIILSNIGGLNRELSNHDKSRAFFEKALLIDKELGDNISVAGELFNIGSLLVETGKYEEALQHLLEALDIYQTNGQKRKTITVLSNIGILYRRLASYEKALEYLNRALKCAANENDVTPEIFNNIGSVYYSMRNFVMASESFRMAVTLTARYLGGSHPIAANAFANLGMILVEQHNYPEALQMFKKAYNISNQSYGADNSFTRSLKEILDKTHV